MNSKLHLNACYHLLIKCGLNEIKATTIANSCLAVDEATERGYIGSVKKAVTAYNTKRLWDAVIDNKVTRDKILCFHFNDVPFDLLYEEAKKAWVNRNYYRLGILLHVIMDGYSHICFERQPSKKNNIELMVKGESKLKHWLLNRAKWLRPEPIGHEEAFGHPDDFDTTWSLDGGKSWINNTEWFTPCFSRIAFDVFGHNEHIRQKEIGNWTKTHVSNRTGYILDYNGWHKEARGLRRWILANEREDH